MRIDLIQCKSTSFQTLCTSNACSTEFSTEFIMNAVKQQNYFWILVWHPYHSLVLVFLWCLYLLLWQYLGIGIPLMFISPFMVISLYIAVGYLLLWSCLFFIFPFMAISPVWSSLVHNSCRSSLCKKTRLRQVFSEGESVLSHVHTQWKHTSPDIAHVSSRRLTKQAHKHIPPTCNRTKCWHCPWATPHSVCRLVSFYGIWAQCWGCSVYVGVLVAKSTLIIQLGYACIVQAHVRLHFHVWWV